MVKEVEFSIVSEIIDRNIPYSNSDDQSLIIGTLKENGTLLNIIPRIPLPTKIFAKRKLFLYFCNVDFDNKLTDRIKLGETDLDYCMRDEGEFTDKVYEFDLSRVLIIPRKVYNTQGTSEITVELYTYEANINTDYGSKRLSVPYTITSDTKYEYDKSTDGIYKLLLIDFEEWVDDRTYNIGDIVSRGDTLLVSTQDNNVYNDTDAEWDTAWIEPTDEDIFTFNYGTTSNIPIRAIEFDLLISRYAKYGIIKDVLLSTGFKSYDDDNSYELVALLQSLREKAKFQLQAHKPIDSLYSLQMLKLASSVSTDTTKVRHHNIKYTT